MCDDHTADDNDRLLAASGDPMSRRRFGAVTGAIGASILLPVAADAMPVIGAEVAIKTPDGTADAYFVAPSTGRHPGVVMWPDIMGLRPAFRQMADRLAQSGYAVLCVNQFYRSTKAPFIKPGESHDQPDVRERIAPFRAALTSGAVAIDARAYIGWLDRQKAVDTRRGIAAAGYCMGGPHVMITAAERPDRVRAGATFHGGGMAAEGPLALIPKMKARFLIAVAANDDARAPDDKAKLREAFATAKLPAEIEVYPGTMHGWCPPDSRVYNAAQANRA